MSEVYYVVMVAGVPMSVTSIYTLAEQAAKEYESANRRATIIPTMAINDDFEEEDPTLETEDDRPEM